MKISQGKGGAPLCLLRKCSPSRMQASFMLDINYLRSHSILEWQQILMKRLHRVCGVPRAAWTHAALILTVACSAVISETCVRQKNIQWNFRLFGRGRTSLRRKSVAFSDAQGKNRCGQMQGRMGRSAATCTHACTCSPAHAVMQSTLLLISGPPFGGGGRCGGHITGSHDAALRS